MNRFKIYTVFRTVSERYSAFFCPKLNSPGGTLPAGKCKTDRAAASGGSPVKISRLCLFLIAAEASGVARLLRKRFVPSGQDRVQDDPDKGCDCKTGQTDGRVACLDLDGAAI